MMPVLFVDDIKTATEFYQDLFELDIEHDFGENIVFKNAFSLWQQERAITIIHGTPRKQAPAMDKPVELYFETPNIEELWRQVQRHDVDVIHEPREEPWGQRTCRIHDPDGYIIEIAEPMNAVVTRLAAAGMQPADIARKTQMSKSTIEQILTGQQ
jgi:predicted enzyme related to lactoylglutathione lyase